MRQSPMLKVRWEQRSASRESSMTGSMRPE
jgi:hypothetical protein